MPIEIEDHTVPHFKAPVTLWQIWGIFVPKPTMIKKCLNMIEINKIPIFSYNFALKLTI